MQTIDSETVKQVWGGRQQLEAEISLYQSQLHLHQFTENQPAPTTHPFIEAVVKLDGGVFEYVDVPEHPEWPDAHAGFVPIQPPPPPVLTLPQMKREVLDRLSERREDREVFGVGYNGHRYSGHPIQLVHMDLALTSLGNFSIRWKDADWEWVMLTRADLLAIQVLLRTMIQKCYDNEYALTLKINAAPTEMALKLISLDNGWPS